MKYLIAHLAFLATFPALAQTPQAPPESPIAQAYRYQRDAAIEREALVVAHIVEMQAQIQALQKQVADARTPKEALKP